MLWSLHWVEWFIELMYRPILELDFGSVRSNAAVLDSGILIMQQAYLTSKLFCFNKVAQRWPWGWQKAGTLFKWLFFRLMLPPRTFFSAVKISFCFDTKGAPLLSLFPFLPACVAWSTYESSAVPIENIRPVERTLCACFLWSKIERFHFKIAIAQLVLHLESWNWA